MKNIKYIHPATGDVKVVRVTQSKNAIMGVGMRLDAPRPSFSMAMADKVMYERGYVRASLSK